MKVGTLYTYQCEDCASTFTATLYNNRKKVCDTCRVARKNGARRKVFVDEHEKATAGLHRAVSMDYPDVII